MERREDARARGRAAGKPRHKALIGRFGIGKVLVFRFLWEGIGIEPIEKLQIHAKAAEGKLWRVQVQVRHAGDDELSRIVEHIQILEPLGLLPEHARRFAVSAKEPAVVQYFNGIRAAAV